MTKSSPASRIQANLKELFKGDLTPGDAYIRFQFASDMTALLSMEQVQWSLVIEAEKITPLPSMPESVIGIMSSRDRVFCVFDLAQLLTFSSRLTASHQYQIIVLQTNSEQPIYLGLAVTHLQGIIRLPMPEIIQPSLAAFPAKIAPYLSGAVQEEEAIVPILDFDRILKALTTAKA
ncbi:MAG: chemotaxis protein CheW [Pleurocapsa sp. MO_192.B19]|nr:chemotaxis protein CheW [Pleurocapsa sp. MO_192.B19]